MPRIDLSALNKFKKPTWFLAACFTCLVIISALGLDLINRQKGEKSHIFAPKKAEQTSIHVPLKPELSEEMIPDVPAVEIEKAEETKVDPPVSPQKEPPSEVKTPAVKESPPLSESAASRKKRGKVAIIVDDMGFSLQTIEDLCSIGESMTIAILPYSPWAVETAHIARNNNLEVILHLPLESLNDYESNQNTEGLIHSGMSEEEILQTLYDSLEQVPFIQGVNNHMGSKITAQRQFMMPILKTLKEKNLFFIDSVTSGRSIAYPLARELGIPTAERHVFLDTIPDEESIKKSLLQLFRLAQRRGTAVGICHPLEETVKVLIENFNKIEDFHCEAVPVSQVLR